ncbi:DMT family transporter [Agromyces cerinus]|uniref:EamA-like transporter family protein n=1 Tax=Agromyces cerinus subsp. cerinus TaxID=232089 RepID=A0A1N6GJT6_9MICO|nr:DMT family transporter [Agromyces cerinus]SIO07787.1 EamA-like transporter family protein [Agromyces cerinus subsp. cerinus]
MPRQPPRDIVRSSAAGIAGQSIALVLLLASTWVVVGIALVGAEAGVVSAGRTVFAAFGLLLLLLTSQNRRSTQTDDRGAVGRPGRYTAWQLVVLAGTGVAGYTMLSTVAIDLAGPTLPSLVLSLSPAVVLMLEARLARARVNMPTLVATGAAIAGTVLFVVPRLSGTAGSDTLLGVLAAIAAMLSMAVYGLYFAQVNLHHVGALTPRILPIFALGSIPLVLWAGIEVSNGRNVDLSSVVILALLGIVIYVPAYLVQHRILLSAGPAYAAVLGLAVPPLVGVASAVLGIADAPGVVQTVGIALTSVAMVFVIRLKFAEHAAAREG